VTTARRPQPVGPDGLRVAMTPLPTPRGNPFIRQLATELVAGGCTLTGASLRAAWHADVLHLHWPDHAVSRDGWSASLRGATKVVLMCAIVRARRRAVVWTVHNLRPHDRRHPGVERMFWPVFTRLVSGCVFLTAAGRDAALAALPGLRHARTVVVPHGSYQGVYPDFNGSDDDARRSLALPADASPLVFFGQLRAYKNVPGLLAAFAALDDPAARLVVAGDGPDEQLIATVRRAADLDDRIVVTGRVADDDVQRVMRAGVGAVLPFHDVFNSGSMFLALSLGRPVLVPRTEVFAEVRRGVGAAWVEFFDPPLAPADLARFARTAGDLVASGATPDLAAFAWPRLGAQIVEFYRTLVPGRRVAAGRGDAG